LSGVFFTQLHNIDKKVGFLAFKIIIDQKHVGLQKVTIKRLRITGKDRKTVKDYDNKCDPDEFDAQRLSTKLRV